MTSENTGVWNGDEQLPPPPKLDPQRAAYARALFARSVMYEMPPEGRDVMLTVERIADLSRTKEVMDWLVFEFCRLGHGVVEHGQSVSGGKVYLSAIFKPHQKGTTQ